MGKILGSWSGMRKYLEQEMLAECLCGRVRYICTSYVGMDGCHIFEIYIDDKLVKQFSWETVNTYYIKNGYKKNSNPVGIREYWDEFWFLMDTVPIEYRTEYTDNEFCEALENYRNQSIKDSITSKNPLERMFAMLDRRIGKRILINEYGGCKMKILLFLAKGFETMEFSVFVDVMGWARNDYNHDVSVVTCGFQKQVISTFNIPVIVDKTIDEINVDDYDALAIPGGFEEFGFYEETYDERFLNLIREFDLKGKIISTICVAALPVGKSGVLKNRKATTYHLRDAYRQKQLKEFDVNVVNEPIVVDRNIITSYCPETASGVAFKLLEMLTSKGEMEIVKVAMGF